MHKHCFSVSVTYNDKIFETCDDSINLTKEKLEELLKSQKIIKITKITKIRRTKIKIP